MTTIDQLRAEAADCAMKTGDKVTLAGSDITGTIVENGGYGYFKVRLDATGKRVIRRFTELAVNPCEVWPIGQKLADGCTDVPLAETQVAPGEDTRCTDCLCPLPAGATAYTDADLTLCVTCAEDTGREVTPL